MTLGKLMLAWTCIGAALGLLLFGAVYLLRDAFAAGVDLADVTMAANRMSGAVIVPSIGVGWLAFKGNAQLTSDAGLRRFAPLLVGALAATAAALALQREFIPEYFPATSPPTVLAGVAALVTAGIFEWMDS